MALHPMDNPLGCHMTNTNVRTNTASANHAAGAIMWPHLQIRHANLLYVPIPSRPPVSSTRSAQSPLPEGKSCFMHRKPTYLFEFPSPAPRPSVDSYILTRPAVRCQTVAPIHIHTSRGCSTLQ